MLTNRIYQFATDCFTDDLMFFKGESKQKHAFLMTNHFPSAFPFLLYTILY